MTEIPNTDKLQQSCITDVISRFKVIGEFPNMDCKLGDIIELPSSDWIYSDGSYCEDKYFETWSHIFERLNGL